jgi:hypothetical protein
VLGAAGSGWAWLVPAGRWVRAADLVVASMWCGWLAAALLRMRSPGLVWRLQVGGRLQVFARSRGGGRLLSRGKCSPLACWSEAATPLGAATSVEGVTVSSPISTQPPGEILAPIGAGGGGAPVLLPWGRHHLGAVVKDKTLRRRVLASDDCRPRLGLDPPYLARVWWWCSSCVGSILELDRASVGVIRLQRIHNF